MVKRQDSKRIKITERALFQRINRKLMQAGEKLCTARSENTCEETGRFYVVGTGFPVPGKRAAPSGVIHTDVKLEELARRLGVIKAWEELGN
jgi:tagatose-1,6-bisphosphate aldolase non-catalytic subunit AgaZ/GatZ